MANTWVIQKRGDNRWHGYGTPGDAAIDLGDRLTADRARRLVRVQDDEASAGNRQYRYEVGGWDQRREEEDGIGLVPQSRHTTFGLAFRAAMRGARELADDGPSTGGCMTWSYAIRRIGDDEPLMWISGG